MMGPVRFGRSHRNGPQTRGLPLPEWTPIQRTPIISLCLGPGPSLLAAHRGLASPLERLPYRVHDCSSPEKVLPEPPPRPSFAVREVRTGFPQYEDDERKNPKCAEYQRVDLIDDQGVRSRRKHERRKRPGKEAANH